MRRYCPPIVDQLKSYAKALRELGFTSIDHRQHRHQNNTIERSHQETRIKENRMHKFSNIGYPQRFLSSRGSISNLFDKDRHKISRKHFKEKLEHSLQNYLNR